MNAMMVILSGFYFLLPFSMIDLLSKTRYIESSPLYISDALVCGGFYYKETEGLAKVLKGTFSFFPFSYTFTAKINNMPKI